MGEISWPALKASRAVLLFGEGEKRVGYASWRRVRTSIWEIVKATAVRDQYQHVCMCTRAPERVGKVDLWEREHSNA